MENGPKLPLIGNIRTLIAGAPDRENVVWELWVDDKHHVAHHIAEVCYQRGELSVQLFGAGRDSKELRVSLVEFVAALTAAGEDFAKTHGL